MTQETNEPKIREAFEAALIKGLKGEPLTNKDGDLVTVPSTGEIVMAAPEASFLSVVRAYLKDLFGDEKAPRVPQTGTAKSPMLMGGTKLPFGVRAQ